MLDVKDAVGLAKTELALLFPEFAELDLRLEEAETPLDKGRWRFTFSAAVPDAPTHNSLAELLKPRRIRKAVELQSESGMLVSIRAA